MLQAILGAMVVIAIMTSMLLSEHLDKKCAPLILGWLCSFLAGAVTLLCVLLILVLSAE